MSASKNKMQELLGESLLTEVKGNPEPTAKLLKDKDLVLLYFSASWCPPCKAFSPKLSEFYTKHSKEGKFEIVYISSDRSVSEFEGYYGKLPFLAIPPVGKDVAAIKSKLAQMLKIQGIPTLVVLDAKTGDFITGQARAHVEQSPTLEQVEQWKSSDRVPIEQADINAGAPKQPLLIQIGLFFAKRPMMIFGLIYLYKWAKRALGDKFPEYFGGAGALEADDEEPPAMPGDTTEF